MGDDVIAVESFVGDEPVEGETLKERCDADRIEAVAGHENEAYEIAQCVGQREDLGGHAALGAAYGLALSPPFAPCPWRWTLTMVASSMVYSMSGSSDTASKRRLKKYPLTKSRYRLKTVFQGPNSG